MRRILIGLSVAAAAGYLLAQPWQPLPASAALKGFAMAPLAALAFTLSRRYGRPLFYLGIALALSCAGDVALDLDARYFAVGLAAFLLAHVEYATLWLMFRPRPFRTTPGRAVWATVAVAASLILGAMLAPRAGSLAEPVALYIAVLAAMVVSAVLSRFPLSGVPLGATLFLVSDAILAWNRFVGPVPAHGFLVWTTYYSGQLLMTLAVLRGVAQPGLERDKLPAGDRNVRHHTTQAS